MGANYMGYAADITCSFPASGKFTPQHRMVYTAVLEANRAVMKACKPGASWPELHRLAERVILEHLKNAGLVQGDVSEMIQEGIGAIFMPHGLGHLLGLDVHDAGGYIHVDGAPPRPTEADLKKLRTARTLGARMVFTVEPGCYFIPPLLDGALADPKQARFLVADKIEPYRRFGGVRIEDNIVITETGAEDMTIVPRT